MLKFFTSSISVSHALPSSTNFFFFLIPLLLFGTRKIYKKIKLDTQDELNKIRRLIEIQLKANYEIDSTKKFINDFIPSEIISRSQVLLDTVLNYLMDAAISGLKETLEN